MPTKLITKNPWATLTAAIRAHAHPSQVAVAYFGQGAARLLPLAEGSHLVVDASERTVKLGLTCPAELLKLQKKGVQVFSVTNLHAKLFVVGRSAFVGSTNASQHSAGTLVEALLQTTEPQAVKDAKQFVQDHCLLSLGPEELKKLQKSYRPPHFPGGGGRRKKGATSDPIEPEVGEVRLAQLHADQSHPPHEKVTLKAGYAAARSAREHRASTHELIDFRWEGRCAFRENQRVIQIMQEKNGISWVYPPAYVRHVRQHLQENVHYVYVEYPKRNRISLDRFIAKLGPASKTKLITSGPVKDKTLARSMLAAWKA